MGYPVRIFAVMRGVGLLLAALILPAIALAEAPLPSWQEGAAKARIVAFVSAVTTEGGVDYVAPEDRIAVFDNDGTLWTEQPYYFQLAFALDRVKALAPQHPEWQTQEPFKSILAGDLGKAAAEGGDHALLDLVMATHAGLTTDEFDQVVRDWFAAARHPKTGMAFETMTFLPMRELLEYLRANGFKTFIVSGGGVEFMRTITERAYGIPPEQVIGSTFTTEYGLVDGVPVLRRLPEIAFVNDGPGKPVGINRVIGRRPILAAGNSDGDYEMLRWVTGGRENTLGLIVHHTDAEREYAYDRASAFGHLDKALTEAGGRGWLVVDMKADWRQIYSSAP